MSENKAKKLPQFLAAITISIGAMGTGTVIGWTSNIADKLRGGDLNNVKLDLSWAGSMMCLGATFVCIPISIMADKIGRKLTVLCTVAPFTVGWLLIIFTQHVAMLLLGRFLTGMAGGSFCIVAPLYTSEISENEIRGTLGTFLQLFIGFGILYSNIFGWAVEVITFCILCAAVPLVFGLCFMFQPETPVYLIKKKKIEKSLVAYQRLRGKDYDASKEIDRVQTQKAKEDEFKEQFTETLKTKAGWKSSLICFSLMFYQQLSGINAVVFYSGAIFKDAGSTIKPEFCAIIIGVVGVFGTFFSSWSVDKLGRKILLMFSLGIMALSTFLLGIYFFMKDKTIITKDTLKSIGWLPLMSLLLFVIAFSIGIGPIPWIASSEIFPPAIMARMSSYACMFNWFLAFLVTVGYEPLSLAVGAYTTFFIFTIVSATGVFFVLFVMPETKGKSFQEIQDALALAS